MFKQSIGNFEMEVPPLVVNPLMGFGYEDSGFRPAFRGFNPPGEPFLSHGKHILRLLKKAGILDLHALGGGEKRLTADIDADTSASRRQKFLGHIIAGETDIPLASRASADGESLNIPFDRTGQPEFESADVFDGEVLAVQSPASLFESETVIPIPAFEAGKPRLISILYPAKEAGIGFIKAFQHVLKHLRASFSVFVEGDLEFRELLNLAVAGYGGFILAVNRDALLKGSVVEPTAKVKPIIGFVKCLRIRQKAIFEGLSHLSRTIFSVAHSEKGVKPCRASPPVSPALKGGVLDSGIL